MPSATPGQPGQVHPKPPLPDSWAWPPGVNMVYDKPHVQIASPPAPIDLSYTPTYCLQILMTFMISS